MQPELRQYLETMICPPEGQILYSTDIGEIPFDELDDCSYHGAILVGEPTPEQAEDLLRILTPGAHVMLMGTEESPTAYNGVSDMEETGFEVRDAIFFADDASRFKYTSKASRKEREAGCGHLPARKGHEAVERKEGSAGVGNPRAGAGRTAEEVRNYHPTCKPVEIMGWCMRDTAPGEYVVEPFGGSGTTACAAPKYGVNVTAIELNEDGGYGAIIDARVRHWANNVYLVPGGVKITSEFEPEEEEEEAPVDFMTLMTMGSEPRMELGNRDGEIEIILLEGDCVKRMKEIESNSVDWIITDPPYGLSFMGKGWDDMGVGAQQREWHVQWLREAFRILKPGRQIKAFCGTRTQHHLLKAMEVVGFEGVDTQKVDSEAWMYGCLSDDSEIWTDRGWIPGTSVRVGDIVGCWDFETGEFSMQPTQEVFRAPYSGDMVSIRNNGLNQLLTPNHRVYHWTKDTLSDQWDPEGWECNEASTLGSEVRVPVLIPEGTEDSELPNLVILARANVGKVPYEGEVWCVRVPTGAFVARREGHIFITGNSGFPKSLDVSKEIDRILGAEREVIGVSPNDRPRSQVKGGRGFDKTFNDGQGHEPILITAPASDEAQKWEGWGTALKPAWEPVCCGRKPLEE